MPEEIKLCKYCKHENIKSNVKCVHCGRFFLDGTTPEKEAIQKKSVDIDSQKIVLLPTILLVISLFLPWMSVFFFKMSAFDMAKLSDLASQYGGRGDITITLVKIIIYLIPVGSIVTGYFVFKGRSVAAIGRITGSLPIFITLILFLKSPEFFRMIDIGLILSVISGIAMIILSRSE